jgi:hypothetical protein
MSYAAADRLDDALDATLTFLRPFDAGRWLRLAVIAFFVGGLGGVSASGQSGVDFTGGDPIRVIDGLLVGIGGRGLNLALIAAAVVALLAVVLGVVFLYVGSVMEFVLVTALERREVSVREPFAARRWQGTKLFGFRLALFAATALVVAAAAGVGFLLQGPGGRFLPVLFGLPVLFVALPVALLVNGLTTVFVVPTMYDRRCGVLDGWRATLPRLREQLGETAVYVLFSVVLSVIGATTIATVVGIVGTLLVLPVGVLGLGLGVLTGGGIALVILAPLLLAVGLAVAALAAVLRVPVLVFLRYYALLVLADLTDVDLLAETRAATEVAPPRASATTENGSEPA